MKSLLSPRQVARAIGVSEASLKRWCDRGLIESVRTGGGHRRLPLHAVVQFLRTSGYPLVKPEVLGLPSNVGDGPIVLERSGGSFADALAAGDSEQARRIVVDLYLARHGPPDLGDRTIAPAFALLGDRWQHGQVEVYQERRGCEICLRTLHELRLLMPAPAMTAPTAFGGTLGGDPYAIATTLVELTLRDAGWRAENFGIGLPAETLAAALREHRPRLFWLSASAIDDPRAFLADYARVGAAAEAAGTCIAVGGRGLTDELRRQMRYTAFCDTLRHLAEFAATLHPLPGSTASPAV